MAPRKPIHRQQKSLEPVKRSTGKPARAREERAPAKASVPLAFDIQVPKALKDILINSRNAIKLNNKASSRSHSEAWGLLTSLFQLVRLPKEYRSPPPLQSGENVDHKESAKKLSRRDSSEIPPGPPTVRETLEQFQEYFLSMEDKSLNQTVDDTKLVPVIGRGVLAYFDKYAPSTHYSYLFLLFSLALARTIAANLLYIEERGQNAFLDYWYRSGAHVNVDPANIPNWSDWYGPDHLLRLLGALQYYLRVSPLISDKLCFRKCWRRHLWTTTL